MRLWLLTTILAGVALAGRTPDEIEKSVFRTWNNGPVRYIDSDLFREEEKEESHFRSKRSLNSIVSNAATVKLGYGTCQVPGYTGEGCIHPICSINNEVVPDNPVTDGLGATIDKTWLANCSQEYLVYVDETMFAITFELESDKALNPYMSLQGSDGTMYSPDSYQRTPSTYEPYYFSLDPGNYKVMPSADLPTSACVLTVRARTQLNVVGGFIYSGSDQARNDFPGGFAYQGLEATAVFHGNYLRSPGKLITLTITGNDNSLYRPRPLETRYNCSYEYFKDGFICNSVGSYLYHVDGITFEGYNFRRTYGFECLPPPPTEPPTTQTTVTMQTTTPYPGCKNNGFQLDGTTTCFCQGLWAGQDCGDILCMNGGTVTTSNTCTCPIGYSGFHCENVACTDNEGIEFDAEHPTLVLVLRVRANMNSINQQVTQAAETLVNALQFDTGYLANFILVLFNNDAIILSKRYTSFVEMDADLLNFAVNSTSPDGDCYDSVFSAVSTALVHYPTNRSPVYVVTDAPPKDNDVAETVFHQDSFWRAPIHFIYVQPDPLCVVSLEDPGYRKMVDISQRTGGQTFYLRNRTRVYDFISSHMLQTVYRSQLVLSNDVLTCALQNSYQAVTVDMTIQQITVVATGENLQLLVTMPDGTNYSLTSTTYDDQSNYIWMVNGPHVGMWTFTVVTTTPGSACSFRISQKFYNNIEGARQPPYDIFWAFAPSIITNGHMTQPLYGVDTGVVVKLTNYPFVLPQYVTAALNIYANRNGKQIELYAANGAWRDACDYNFYFPSFTCYKPNEVLYFNFYARDEYGFAIQRAGNMYCSEIQPTLNPPSECQNGGIPNGNDTDCFCPMGYSGSKCEQIVCYNGGTPQGTKCVCLQNWWGDFCELPRCTEPGASPEYQLKYVDMIFAIEMTQLGGAQIGYLNKFFGELLRNIVSQDPKWIRRFVLTGFNSTWADVLAVADANHYQVVVDTLDNITNTLYKDPNLDKGCNVQAFRAFDVAVLKRDALPGSYMELFITSTPDNTDVVGWEQLYDFQRSMNLHINTFLAVKSSNQNQRGYFCNGTDDDFYWLNAVAGSSAGEIYYTDPALTKDFINTIPLQFYSQVVYNNYNMDCTSGVKWYFPIDAYVQTIQLDVYGQNPNIVVYDQDGNPYDQLSVASDSFSGLTINTIRKACDDGWESHGDYCFLFNTQMLSWPEAKSFCHMAGGQLVDDMTDVKHSYLMSIGSVYTFWIGLFNNGSDWFWDRPDGSQPVLLQQDPVYWTGGSPPTDPTLQCGKYVGAGRLQDNWNGEHCSTPLWSLCQKHRYDQNFRPENLVNDDLPDGKWSIFINTTASGTYPTKTCGVTIRVQSELQIFTGYAQSVGQDTPDQDPYRESSLNRIISYIHSQDNDYRNPFLSMAYLNDAANGTFYNAARYQERVSCTYPWVTQTFACPNNQNDGNEFMVTHSGEDSFGNMFQRITFGHCARTPLTCGAGGYRWQGQCICSEYWQGRYCTVPVCVNNGTLSADNSRCECPAGYTGFNCQFAMCTQPNSIQFYDKFKTLVLIVENTIQNQGAIRALATNINSIISQTESQWFTSFLLGTFDSQLNTAFDFYDTVDELVTALNSLTQTDQGSCSMPIYSAINAYLNDPNIIYLAWPNSEMLLVTAAGTAGDNKRRDDLIQLSDQRITLDYIYNSDSCGDIPTDGSLYDLTRTVYTTGGSVAFMNSSQIANYLTVFLPARYQANSLSHPTAPQNFTCDTDNSWMVQVDTNTSYLYITLTSEIGSLGVFDPMKNQLQPDLLFSQGSTRFYRINTRGDAGIYKLNVKSTGNCFASIWATGGPSVPTLFSLTTANSPSGSSIDGLNHSPTAFVQNILTAHIIGEPGHRAHLLYAEIRDVDTAEIILRSELYRRDGPYDTYPGSTCQFEYYSDPFTCNSDLLAVYTYGMDENYIQFRRYTVAFCLNSTQTTITSTPSTSPTSTTTTTPSTTITSTTTRSGTTGTTQSTLPPTTSFSNLNLAFDVVFLLDVSQAAADTYSTISKFVQTLMLSYTIGIYNAQVALIPVRAAPFTFPIAMLNSVTSQSSLIGYLNSINGTFDDFDEAGQYVQPALDEAIRPEFISNGYRTSINNHLIIYITSTTTFSDQPKTDTIRSSKQYGVITVGYGATATDQNALQGLAGGANCAFTAADVASLNTDVAQKIRDLIWAANFNGGVYCGM